MFFLFRNTWGDSGQELPQQMVNIWKCSTCDIACLFAIPKYGTLKEVIFSNRKILHLVIICFHELASSKYFAGINFREYTLFYLSNTFISNARLKLAKN